MAPNLKVHPLLQQLVDCTTPATSADILSDWNTATPDILADAIRACSTNGLAAVFEHVRKWVSALVEAGLNGEIPLAEAGTPSIPTAIQGAAKLLATCAEQFPVGTVTLSLATVHAVLGATVMAARESLSTTDPWPSALAIAVRAVLNVIAQWWSRPVPGVEQLLPEAVPVALALASRPDAAAADVKPLVSLADALALFDWSDESCAVLKQYALRAYLAPKMVASASGRRVLVSLASVDASLAVDVIDVVAGALPGATAAIVAAYADIWYRAWAAAAEGAREEHQAHAGGVEAPEGPAQATLQALEGALLRVLRGGLAAAQPGTARAVRRVVQAWAAARAKRAPAAGTLLVLLLEPLIARGILAPNPIVRARALAFLGDAFPLVDTAALDGSAAAASLVRDCAALAEGLADDAPRVRVAAADAAGLVLARYWDLLPAHHVKATVAALAAAASDRASGPVRQAAIAALTTLTSTPAAHATLAALLPALVPALHDKVARVSDAAADLLVAVADLRAVDIWSVLPVDAAMAALTAAVGNGRTGTAQRLASVLLPAVWPAGAKGSELAARMLGVAGTQPAAFCAFLAAAAGHASLQAVAKLLAVLAKAVNKALAKGSADAGTGAGANGAQGKKRGRAQPSAGQVRVGIPKGGVPSGATLHAANVPLMATLLRGMAVLAAASHAMLSSEAGADAAESVDEQLSDEVLGTWAAGVVAGVAALGESSSASHGAEARGAGCAALAALCTLASVVPRAAARGVGAPVAWAQAVLGMGAQADSTAERSALSAAGLSGALLGPAAPAAAELLAVRGVAQQLLAAAASGDNDLGAQAAAALRTWAGMPSMATHVAGALPAMLMQLQGEVDVALGTSSSEPGLAEALASWQACLRATLAGATASTARRTIASDAVLTRVPPCEDVLASAMLWTRSALLPAACSETSKRSQAALHAAIATAVAVAADAVVCGTMESAAASLLAGVCSPSLLPKLAQNGLLSSHIVRLSVACSRAHGKDAHSLSDVASSSARLGSALAALPDAEQHTAARGCLNVLLGMPAARDGVVMRSIVKAVGAMMSTATSAVEIASAGGVVPELIHGVPVEKSVPGQRSCAFTAAGAAVRHVYMAVLAQLLDESLELVARSSTVAGRPAASPAAGDDQPGADAVPAAMAYAALAARALQDLKALGVEQAGRALAAVVGGPRADAAIAMAPEVAAILRQS